MNEHEAALAGLQNLENHVGHNMMVLQRNGFPAIGPDAMGDVTAEWTAIYERINRIKQIVLLDGYSRGVVKVTS
jgi:hypothetical protein